MKKKGRKIIRRRGYNGSFSPAVPVAEESRRTNLEQDADTFL